MAIRQFNFFDRVVVNTNDFSDHLGSFNFVSTGLLLLNESEVSGEDVEYSFNGQDVHGILRVGFADQGLAKDGFKESKIWLRLASGAVGPVTVRVEAWA